MDLSTVFLLAVGILVFSLMGVYLFARAGQSPNAVPEPGETCLAPNQGDSLAPLEQHGMLPLPSLVLIEYCQPETIIPPSRFNGIAPAMLENARKMLAGMAPQPTMSTQLETLLRSPDVTAKQVAAFVSTNPVISSLILRTINSSFFGLTSKVSSVGRAVTLLGFNNVRAIVMRDALNSVLAQTKTASPEIDGIWLHSTVVSACAMYLSRNVLSYKEFDMGTLGLFHDIGKFFLPFVEVHTEAAVEPPSTILAAEAGIDHAQLGSMLADHWQMAEVVGNCIAYHHYPVFFPIEEIPEPYRKPVFIISLADLICKALGYGSPHGELLPIQDEYFEAFGLSPDVAALVDPPLVREIEKARVAVESYFNGH